MLAIIIPYYKYTFFEATLQSLANQTDKRFKVYIGDDASTENPTELLFNYKGQIDFVYHRFESNLGRTSLTKQWERCIALTEDEEWLMILGDDDALGNNVVEEFYLLLKSHKTECINLIRFCLQIIDSNGVFEKNDFLYQDYEPQQKLLERIFSIKETITINEFIFSRIVYNHNKGFVEFPLAWFSDYATWILFANMSGLYNIKNASVYWRLSGVNISSKSTDSKEIELKIKGLFLFISFLQQHFIIYEIKQKKFAYIHLKNLLSNLTALQSFKILVKFLFKQNCGVSREIIIEFILKKIKEKIRKVYENICST
jgi:glycosyltransferase involved in cell wall biosynthesis